MTDRLERDGATRRADREPSDRPALGSLIVFGDDDQLICLDDTCVPAEIAATVGAPGSRRPAQ